MYICMYVYICIYTDGSINLFSCQLIHKQRVLRINLRPPLREPCGDPCFLKSNASSHVIRIVTTRITDYVISHALYWELQNLSFFNGFCWLGDHVTRYVTRHYEKHLRKNLRPTLREPCGKFDTESSYYEPRQNPRRRGVLHATI